MLPYEMSRDMFGDSGGMKLYIKRVFISDKVRSREERSDVSWLRADTFMREVASTSSQLPFLTLKTPPCSS